MPLAVGGCFVVGMFFVKQVSNTAELLGCSLERFDLLPELS
jgi:hypothetical protein